MRTVILERCFVLTSISRVLNAHLREKSSRFGLEFSGPARLGRTLSMTTTAREGKKRNRIEVGICRRNESRGLSTMIQMSSALHSSSFGGVEGEEDIPGKAMNTVSSASNNRGDSTKDSGERVLNRAANQNLEDDLEDVMDEEGVSEEELLEDGELEHDEEDIAGALEESDDAILSPEELDDILDEAAIADEEEGGELLGEGHDEDFLEGEEEYLDEMGEDLLEDNPGV